MSKLLHIVKRKISFNQCTTFIRLMLDDLTKDNLSIRVDKRYDVDENNRYCDLVISYFKKEVLIASKSK